MRRTLSGGRCSPSIPTLQFNMHKFISSPVCISLYFLCLTKTAFFMVWFKSFPSSLLLLQSLLISSEFLSVKPLIMSCLFWVTDISSQINCTPLSNSYFVLYYFDMFFNTWHKYSLYSLKIIIELFFLLDSSLELFLLIHNLDSQMLRGDKSQQIIGQLSSLRNIYLIASIDHLNAPLSKLNMTIFCSWDISLTKLIFLIFFFFFLLF